MLGFYETSPTPTKKKPKQRQQHTDHQKYKGTNKQNQARNHRSRKQQNKFKCGTSDQTVATMTMVQLNLIKKRNILTSTKQDILKETEIMERIIQQNQIMQYR